MSPSPTFLPSTHTRHFYVSIQPPVGELMAPVFMSENEFKKEQGELGTGTGQGKGGAWAPTASVPMFTPHFVPTATPAMALEHLARPGEGKWPPLD